MDPRAYFIIGGDGPKMLKLKEVIEVNRLHDRVELLGEVGIRVIMALIWEGFE